MGTFHGPIMSFLPLSAVGHPFLLAQRTWVWGPLNISPLPAGAVLNLVRRGCQRAGFCLPGQVDVPGPSALRAGSFSRALHGEEGSSSTHGSSLPCTPEHVGDFVAQPFPMTSFPWHPLGQISNRCDQSNGASTSLSPIQQTTASAPQQDLGLRLVIVVGGVGVGVGWVGNGVLSQLRAVAAPIICFFYIR